MILRTTQFRPVAAVLLLSVVAAPAQETTRLPEPGGADERLGKRLIRKAVTDADEDVMDAVIHLMEETARRLEIEFDAGDGTQTLQRDILERLGDAIKAAASQRRLRRQVRGVSTADKRRMQKAGRRRTDRDRKKGGDDGNSTSTGTTEPTRTAADRRPVGGELSELRRAWGHLPMREREEIIQGVTESFLERYREWIERYYRALQEAED